MYFFEKKLLGKMLFESKIFGIFFSEYVKKNFTYSEKKKQKNFRLSLLKFNFFCIEKKISKKKISKKKFSPEFFFSFQKIIKKSLSRKNTFFWKKQFFHTFFSKFCFFEIGIWYTPGGR